VLQEMFCDPSFQGKWHLNFEEKLNDQGDRVFGSFHSGEYFEHLQVFFVCSSWSLCSKKNEITTMPSTLVAMPPPRSNASGLQPVLRWDQCPKNGVAVFSSNFHDLCQPSRRGTPERPSMAAHWTSSGVGRNPR